MDAPFLLREVTHARIDQGKTRDRGTNDLNEEYADVMGGYAADGMEFSSATYNNVQLDRNAVTNNHTQTDADKAILAKNNATWNANIERAQSGEGKLENRQLYQQEAKLLDEAKQQIRQDPKLNAEERLQKELLLNAAACAAIQCAEGVPESDVHYQQLAKLQALGNTLKANDVTVESLLGTPLPEGTFGYGIGDRVQDAITRNDEGIQRTKGAVNAGLGTAGTVAGGAATIATAPACPTVLGCALPAATAAGTVLAAGQAVDGIATLFGDYTSEEGQRVLDSFTAETHPGDRNLVGDAVKDTVIWAGEALVIKKVSKLIPNRVVEANQKGKTIADGRSVVDLDISAGKGKGSGNYSDLTDPTNTYRSPTDGRLRADEGHAQKTGTYVKEEGRSDPVYDVRPGSEVNQAGAERYGDRYRPEHVPDKSVVTTDFPQDREMVHVFNADPRTPVDSQKVGDWVMPKSEIARPDGTMMGPSEIQNRYSLPEPPTHIADVKPDRPVQATVSTAAGRLPENGGTDNHFGDGGGQQWRIQEDVKNDPNAESWFQNPRPLE